MMKMIPAMIIAVLLAYAVPAFAGGDDILGTWNNGIKDAKIEISKCAEKYCGKIVWLREPTYPEGSKDGTPGTPKIDIHNKDVSLQTRPIMGLQIISGFVYDGQEKWKDGKVYDPKKGKTYSALITLPAPNQLKLRGYVGASVFGRNELWTR